MTCIVIITPQLNEVGVVLKGVTFVPGVERFMIVGQEQVVGEIHSYPCWKSGVDIVSRHLCLKSSIYLALTQILLFWVISVIK